MESLNTKTQKELSNLAKRLSDLDRENATLRKDREIQKQVIEKQGVKVKDLKQMVELFKRNQDGCSDNNYATDTSQTADKISKFYPRARSSSQKRRKRGSSQKREKSNKRQSSKDRAKIVTLMQEVIGNPDPSSVSMLPVDIPYLKDEERDFNIRMSERFLRKSKDDSKVNILAIKSVARIRSLNKL